MSYLEWLASERGKWARRYLAAVAAATLVLNVLALVVSGSAAR